MVASQASDGRIEVFTADIGGRDGWHEPTGKQTSNLSRLLDSLGEWLER